MRLLRAAKPFDHREFVYERKTDGFRALAHICRHACDLVSRNGYTSKFWPQLAEELAHALRCRDAVLDGEICCLEPNGDDTSWLKIKHPDYTPRRARRAVRSARLRHTKNIPL